ncbi:hypothetical protein EB796_004048 [Bugula neritina]|uniref:Uncharacterized protein n=1 Tax=Bugula neritina TaxID=10212 RepID=A0A7J7KJY8_BUGNE|nr:hypothetical protein EB796_004048 [Bugula neritina]
MTSPTVQRDILDSRVLTVLVAASPQPLENSADTQFLLVLILCTSYCVRDHCYHTLIPHLLSFCSTRWRVRHLHPLNQVTSNHTIRWNWLLPSNVYIW